MMNDNEKLIEEAVACGLAASDDLNHEQLCSCGSWPESCVTYGDRRPWSHDAEFVARTALAVFEKASTPKRTVIQITPEAVQREYDLRNGATPPDDEREAMRRIIAQGSYSMTPESLPYEDVAYRLVEAGFGFRRSVVPEPSNECCDVLGGPERCGDCPQDREEPQGDEAIGI